MNDWGSWSPSRPVFKPTTRYADTASPPVDVVSTTKAAIAPAAMIRRIVALAVGRIAEGHVARRARAIVLSRARVAAGIITTTPTARPCTGRLRQEHSGKKAGGKKRYSRCKSHFGSSC